MTTSAPSSDHPDILLILIGAGIMSAIILAMGLGLILPKMAIDRLSEKPMRSRT